MRAILHEVTDFDDHSRFDVEVPDDVWFGDDAAFLVALIESFCAVSGHDPAQHSVALAARCPTLRVVVVSWDDGLIAGQSTWTVIPVKPTSGSCH
jgi:hypothetical protein